MCTLRDKNGLPFDADLHAVNEDGSPIVTNAGTLRIKSGGYTIVDRMRDEQGIEYALVVKGGKENQVVLNPEDLEQPALDQGAAVSTEDFAKKFEAAKRTADIDPLAVDKETNKILTEGLNRLSKQSDSGVFMGIDSGQEPQKARFSNVIHYKKRVGSNWVGDVKRHLEERSYNLQEVLDKARWYCENYRSRNGKKLKFHINRQDETISCTHPTSQRWECATLVQPVEEVIKWIHGIATSGTVHVRYSLNSEGGAIEQARFEEEYRNIYTEVGLEDNVADYDREGKYVIG